ncbi:MAG: hypothetical protein HYV27_19850 [Candidatus Hydrogenedentes bacterium]|nr:hypothetical protein [Candidatus Hydrogenedentota bacterium]
MTIRAIAILMPMLFLLAHPGAFADWYKGATHVHSLWSDGDAAPETIAAWYLDRGWDFVCFSEHNVIQTDPERFVAINEKSKMRPEHLAEIKARFGDAWPVLREENGQTSMRLRTHEELKGLLEKPGEFLLIPAEEMTTIGSSPHVNAINVVEPVRGLPMHPNRTKSIQTYIDVVEAQRAQFGKPMFAHVNHVNFSDRITTEELLGVRGLRFFEVYNGHPAVHSWGIPGEQIPPCDRHWDVVLAQHLQADPADMLYGVATDDSHNYFKWAVGESNPGRGWVTVRASKLEPDAITQAMLDGDFYASTGVTLSDISFDGKTVQIKIEGAPGVTYRTEYIGTRKGYDATGKPALDAKGAVIPRSSKLYSESIGAVLAHSTDLNSSYTMTGDEIYVRARIASDKKQENPHQDGDCEMAWTQPVAPK